ncbi:NUMOD4 domain-containing protein [Alkalihalobacillus sp. BA299]|uniref:NUMOD4 domain-containing protein n=1 Tax=Alkalihalobacillus sp. BA299 TaxID=2815938 RepID=UPI001ADCA33F|nr:NUMOD4 domain-containing protein [Alkalihalobacillus sp. BA299]
MEIWKDVKDFEGLYQISNLGRLKNGKGKLIQPADNGKGYLRFNLSKGNRNYKTVYLHRALAEAFIPNPNNLPEVNHKDENKRNNNINNLEWCTVKYNRRYGTRNIRTGMKHRKKIRGINLNDNSVIEFDSCVEAECNGFNKSAISNCLQGISNSSKGYKWERV